MLWIRDTIELAKDLRTQRGRAVSTLFGITWGTLSVVLLLAFGRSIEALMVERSRNFGEGIVIAWPQSTTRSFQGFGRGRRLRLTADDVDALSQQVTEIGAISPEFIDYATLRVGERVLSATVSGVHPAYGWLRTMRPQQGGRFLNQHDVSGSRRVAFLGDRVARGMFGAQDSVGQTVLLRGVPFLVVGVLEPKDQDSDYQGEDRDRVCIPATTHQTVFGRRFVNYAVWRAASPALHERALRRAYEVLGRRLRFDPDDRHALSVWDLTEQQTMLSWVFFGFNLLLGASGAFTLFVGGVGVGNLMYIMVRQRTRELGIQLALGAQPRWIMRRVLMQTTMLVAIGGSMGFLLSVGCTAVARALPLEASIGDPVIDPTIAAATIGLLSVIALLAGWFPARRAARLDPITAMNA